MIKNEMRFILTKKKICIYILLLFSFVSLFLFKYDKEYKAYSDTQIEYYSNIIDAENQRIKMSADVDLICFFNNDIVNCQKLLVDFKQNEDIKIIANDLYNRDCEILNYLKKNVNLSNFPSVLQNTELDLKIRVKQERIYLENKYYDFVYKNKPTGLYLLLQIFEEGNFFFYLFMIMALVINVDSWSKDLENGTIIYLLTVEKNKIYLMRTLVHTIFTVLLGLLYAAIVFGIGYINYGSGEQLYVNLSPIKDYVFYHFICFMLIEIFAISIVQFMSFLTKNTGINLMLFSFALIYMYVYLNFNALWNLSALFVLLTIGIQIILLVFFKKSDLG